jgi:hypothetical protein
MFIPFGCILLFRVDSWKNLSSVGVEFDCKAVFPLKRHTLNRLVLENLSESIFHMLISAKANISTLTEIRGRCFKFEVSLV